MMKSKTRIYLKGAAVITATMAMAGCEPKPYSIDETGCYLKASPRLDASLAKNRSAIFIGLGKDGQLSVGYPNQSLWGDILRTSTKAEFSAVVAAATNAQMVFYPTSDYRPPTPPNPLDLRTSSNTTVAFRLSPAAWSFIEKGFSLKSEKHGGFSPFTHSIPQGFDNNILLVDYDRTAGVTGKACVYQYNLLAQITSTNRGLTSVLPITLDPGWGNNDPPAPPSDMPTPP